MAIKYAEKAIHRNMMRMASTHIIQVIEYVSLIWIMNMDKTRKQHYACIWEGMLSPRPKR
jgi:hypothetical protein